MLCVLLSKSQICKLEFIVHLVCDFYRYFQVYDLVLSLTSNYGVCLYGLTYLIMCIFTFDFKNFVMPFVFVAICVSIDFNIFIKLIFSLRDGFLYFKSFLPLNLFLTLAFFFICLAFSFVIIFIFP